MTTYRRDVSGRPTTVVGPLRGMPFTSPGHRRPPAPSYRPDEARCTFDHDTRLRFARGHRPDGLAWTYAPTAPTV
ncbi:hypothetical protein ABZ598_07385 [Streptomyces albus]